MIFNSLEFVAFFAVFYFFYWLVLNKNLFAQNLLLLIGSYFFYAWWDYRFLSLLIASSLINYYLGLKIAATENEKFRRIYVFLGLAQGLGGLLYFKYTNFFITSFVDSFSEFGIQLNVSTLNIILPLGISFYTFRTISYILDIDNEKIEPERNWIVFFNYVSFFPSLMAGPIDRANHLIPQLVKQRKFSHSLTVDGLRQILWGLFKKLVIADNCAVITDQIFSDYQSFSGSTLLLGAFLYIIQIYADFSGYSDMAIGVAKLLGFRISRNFNYPFFAENIAEFWQRWHISLTSWMTEYVYTPLSFIFRNKGKLGMIMAIIINFILVGLWHGSNWTFIVFGFLQGCYFIPLILMGSLNKKRLQKSKNINYLNMAGTFGIVMLSSVLFRSPTLSDAIGYYTDMFSLSIFSLPALPSGGLMAVFTLIFIFILFFIEWIGKDHEFAIANLFTEKPRLYRWSLYYLIIILIFTFGVSNQEFIYFQF